MSSPRLQDAARYRDLLAEIAPPPPPAPIEMPPGSMAITRGVRVLVRIIPALLTMQASRQSAARTALSAERPALPPPPALCPQVESYFVPAHSMPAQGQYFFAYKVTIANEVRLRPLGVLRRRVLRLHNFAPQFGIF